MGLRYEPLSEEDAPMVASWFDEDPDGQRRFGGFYGAHPKWWELTRRDDFRHAWIVRQGRDPVGFLDLEISDRRAVLSFYVVEERRGQGVGRQIAAEAARYAERLGAE